MIFRDATADAPRVSVGIWRCRLKIGKFAVKRTIQISSRGAHSDYLVRSGPNVVISAPNHQSSTVQTASGMLNARCPMRMHHIWKDVLCWTTVVPLDDKQIRPVDCMTRLGQIFLLMDQVVNPLRWLSYLARTSASRSSIVL